MLMNLSRVDAGFKGGGGYWDWWWEEVLFSSKIVVPSLLCLNDYNLQKIIITIFMEICLAI